MWRRIPENVLREAGESNRAKEDLIRFWRTRFGVHSKLASLLSDLRPKSREEILRNHDILSAVSPSQFLIFFRPPLRELRSPLRNQAKGIQVVPYKEKLLLTQYSEIRTNNTDQLRFSIGDCLGEIISASVDQKVLPDVSTIRFLSYTPWELHNVTELEREHLHARLHNISRADLQQLLADDVLRESQDDRALIFRTLAGLLLMLQNFTRFYRQESKNQRRSTESFSTVGGGSSGTGVITIPDPVTSDRTDPCENANGCGPDAANLGELVPDFNFSRCCDEHDRCYCRGCSSCERMECDDALYQCILRQTGNPSLAATYYAAVRAFGNLGSFNNCNGLVGAGGLISVGIGIAVGIGVGISVNPIAGITAGTLAGAFATWVSSIVTCALCEAVTWLLEDITEWVNEELRKLEEWRRQETRKCKRKKWWRRWLCRLRIIISYILKIIWIVVVATITMITLIPISMIVC